MGMGIPMGMGMGIEIPSPRQPWPGVRNEGQKPETQRADSGGGVLGERCKLSQRGPGRSPGR